uniref:Putative ixodegrin protein n=1 Tax=Ixodes ricinus TaxID=34613 RepID=A0A0K8R4N2_IXORI
MKTDFTALALTFVVASLLADVISSQGQQPVLPGLPSRPTPPGKLGQPCTVYHGCERGLCCLLTNNKNKARATCQRKPGPGEQCSEEQVKGGLYTTHCPCLRGPCPPGPRATCPYLPDYRHMKL